MPRLNEIPPEILHDRHRLSSQQINSLLGEETVAESVEEKIDAFETVSEFIRVTDALRNAGVSFIPLKGPELSYRLYGDPTIRSYSDLDILVEVIAMNKAAHILERLGYPAETAAWPAGEMLQQNIINHTNEFLFYNTEKQLRIELHWRLLKTPMVSYSRLEEIVRHNQTSLTFAGRSFSVLSNELVLLYLIIHGGIHCWRWLKWLVDIDIFLRRQPIDWKRFADLVAELKADRMVALGNAILSEYFPDGPLIPGTQKARLFMVKFTHKMIRSQKELTEDFYSRIIQSVLFALISFPGIRYKIKTIRNYLFVKEFIREKSFFSSLPIFYLYGPVKLAIIRFKE
jgi:hypothetical protein